jgi:Mn2+/Fe2+ NRAMP family transporter
MQDTAAAAPAGKAIDPYRLDPGDVEEPPATMRATLRRIGPGMILAASIVGSGELIATTTLGAEEGYRLLWLIIVSCLIKPVVQAELGRYSIATGEPSLESFNRVPGPRARVSWAVWAWAIMVLMTMLQVGAMFGGVAQVMHLIVPGVPIWTWVLTFFVITLLLLLGGGYDRIERLAIVKVGLFTMLTVLAAALLMRRPEYFSWGAISGGFALDMPSKGLFTAVAVFGVTGVGTGELFMYPYWCVEKGYARFAGRRDGSAAWTRRARGWIRVMHVDIIASMIVYTLATIAFYLLGAGVLNGMGVVPRASEMISTLSKIYTETLGGWALYVFYAGAIVTLYGTIFAATAAHSRIYADMARLLGAFPREDFAARTRYRNRFVVMLTVVPVALYFLVKEPVFMVKLGATAQSVMLPVVAFGTLYLRHKHLPREVSPRHWVTGSLWVACLMIVAFMGASLVMSFGGR